MNRKIPSETLSRARFLDRFNAARSYGPDFHFTTVFKGKRTREILVQDIAGQNSRVVLNRSGEKGHYCSCRDGARLFAIPGVPPASLCVHVIACMLFMDEAALLAPWFIEADRRKARAA